MLKRASVFINIVVVVAMILSWNSAYAVDTYGGYNIPVDIDVNGSFIKCAEKPIMINNVTYIPLRAFSDAIGGTIEWDEKEMAAKLIKDGHSFVFYLGKDYCLMDGAEKKYTSFFYKDLTFIPVRAVSEMLGYGVAWDDFYLTVKITAPSVVVKESFKDKSYTYEDIMYLGKITHIESGNQPFVARLGVAGTVVNRMKSSLFPNTIKDVIFDKKYGVQFPPAHTTKINTVPSKESVIAAKCVLGGVNIVRNSIYFADARYASSSWAHKNRPYYITLGDIAFYE